MLFQYHGKLGRFFVHTMYSRCIMWLLEAEITSLTTSDIWQMKFYNMCNLYMMTLINLWLAVLTLILYDLFLLLC